MPFSSMFALYLAPRPMVPVTADTSVLIDELMAGTRRNTKKQHVSHSSSRENQVMAVMI